MTTTNLPADWALEEALKRCDDDFAPESFKNFHAEYPNSQFSRSIIELARMIEAHEQPPVDPLLVEARELHARNYPEAPVVQKAFRSGKHDGTLEFTINILRRGIEIGRGE